MIDIDFFRCDNRLKHDDLILDYNILNTELSGCRSALCQAQKRITELGFKIYNQKREIANLHKKIKELKNGKN